MQVEEVPGLQRPIPVPTDLTKPFWEAANQEKLVVQQCSHCNTLFYPPRERCNSCGSTDPLGWKEVEGKGHIDVHLVIRDSRIRGFRSAQPINFVIVRLDEDPGLNFLSNLPGSDAGDVHDDGPVELVFVKAANADQLIPEWRAVK
jgi:uncharacterized OB-fold protein